MKNQNVLIVHPSNEKQEIAIKEFLNANEIKFEFSKDDNPYAPELISKVQKGREDYHKGKGKSYTIEDLDSLWK